ncbi:PRC and DUF2382 domain-containing protein [Arthrobacter agilis]|uniref:PRC and DUF2382 domain-containing protein n=1 Tax=Arthrobacter agilis TaxID=37921 RepID=UPI002365E71C|nr:PRC and DUF2382 domain-containing protein [Arthrobacter agilis]WDF33567.1 PRC and DUF2382 domain-containing protein [Arthrobacter agilis]
MLTMNDLDPLLRRRSPVVTGEGEKVGPIGVVYLDDADERPTWVTVHTGLFGTRESFVPLKGATVQGRELVVAYSRDQIRHAPSIDRDGHLGPGEEAALRRYYGPAVPAQAGPTDKEIPARSSGHAPTAAEEAPSAPDPTVPDGTLAEEAPSTPDPTVPDGALAREDGGTPWVVRSEERLRVGTEQHIAAHVRLRKYVVTEEATVSVPLLREELKVDIEPIDPSVLPDDGNGASFQEESVEFVAREEHALVSKETVPVERVRMSTVTLTGRTTLREDVRKERITSSVDRGTGSPDDTPETRRAIRGSGRRSSRRGVASPEVEAEDGGPRIATRGTNALLKGNRRR